MTQQPKSYQGIMLSSTFTDLVEHRQAAIAAIQHLGFHPNAMEYSGATIGPDVLDKSLQMVADSAAYILIIGHRYGQSPVDPKRNPDGRSITELEFDEAIRLELPILLFVMSDDHPVTRATGGWEPDPATAAKLAAFIARAKLKDPRDTTSTVTRIWEPFSSKENFAGGIGIAIGKLALELNEALTEASISASALARDVLARLDSLTIPEKAVRGAIARFIDVRPDAVENEVVQAVERFETDYRALQGQVASIAIIDNRIASLKADAEQGLRDGDLDIARRLYGEAAMVAREKASEPVRATAQLLEAEARAHLLALDWKAADKAWASASMMLTAFDLAVGEEVTSTAAYNFYEYGERFGRIELFCAASSRYRSLASAAIERGDVVRGASFQSILSVVLQREGERTAGEAGLLLLDDSIAACRAALLVRTQTTMPHEWSMTQNNLGNALATKGSRIKGEVGLETLAAAVEAFRAAIKMRTRDEEPVGWAKVQNNLGNVLKRQGQRTEGENALLLLAEAIEAHRAALTVRTKKLMPIEWAMTQNNLGNALLAKGIRAEGDARAALINESIMTHKAALSVRNRVKMPAAWARSKCNLAPCYEAMANIGASPKKNLKLAIMVLCEALSFYTPEHMSFDYENATRSLARVREKLAALDTSPPEA